MSQEIDFLVIYRSKAKIGNSGQFSPDFCDPNPEKAIARCNFRTPIPRLKTLFFTELAIYWYCLFI
ncbi:MAG: hypothetical protein QNJ70_24855 [Xenococcaceae cyanobacterium MO_207.B15]|nr:hypothetical protein [Xenococcaceae cyanobacterium MO_207.B15]